MHQSACSCLSQAGRQACRPKGPTRAKPAAAPGASKPAAAPARPAPAASSKKRAAQKTKTRDYQHHRQDNEQQHNNHLQRDQTFCWPDGLEVPKTSSCHAARHLSPKPRASQNLFTTFRQNTGTLPKPARATQQSSSVPAKVWRVVFGEGAATAKKRPPLT